MATPTTLPATFNSGDVLTAANVNGLRGAFRILQVVQAQYTTSVSTTSSTYIDTGLTASITPQSSTSQILVMVSQNVYAFGASTGCNFRIVRNGTTISDYFDLSFGTGGGVLAMHSFIYLDSPATTSAVTYKTTFNRSQGAGTCYVQTSSNPARITLFEISA
jgi:hypothetical protein